MTMFKRLRFELNSFNLLFQSRDKTIVTFFVAFCSFFLISWGPVTERFERKALDLKIDFQARFINTEISRDIIILAIDSETLRKAPAKWPWPHSYWSSVIEKISQRLDPEFLVLDIFFQDYEDNPAFSEVFAHTIKQNGKVGLVSIFEEHYSGRGQQLKFFPPIKYLRDSAAFWGMSQFPIDSDGQIRSFLLFDHRLDKFHVSWEAFKAFGTNVLPEHVLEERESVKLLLNFKLDEARIPIFPLHKILEDNFSFPRLKNRKIIVGATAPILHDYHQTPIGIINGPELVGNSIETISSNRLQILDLNWGNRLFYFFVGLFFAIFPFLDFFKNTWKPLLAEIILLPPALIGYSFFPLVHPPIALTYIVFFSFSLLLLSLVRLNELNRIQQSLHEAEICGSIQQKFFPDKVLACEPGFTISGRCVPYQNAGGDYFDYLSLGEDRVFFILGDVAGHGISASMLTTVAKAVVMINLASDVFLVENVLGSINKAILSLTKRRLMSAVSGIVDFKAGKISIHSAGHLPAVLKTENGVEEVKIPGIPLGVSKRFKLLDPVHLEIPESGKIVVYSDGIVEAVDWKDNMLGFDKFFDIVDKMPMELSVEESIDYLFSQLATHTDGRENQDDVTVLVMSFNNGGLINEKGETVS